MLPKTKESEVRERKLERKLWGSGGRSARERPCRRRSPVFLQNKSPVPVSPFLFPVSAVRRSGQPSTAVVMMLESRRVCGKDGGLSCAFLVSGIRRLSQIRRRRSLHPRRGSFLSSAVVSSSPRGVKAITASRRRISSPSILGFDLFSLILYHRLVLRFVCARVGGERRSLVETVMLHAIFSLGGCGERWWR